MKVENELSEIAIPIAPTLFQHGDKFIRIRVLIVSR